MTYNLLHMQSNWSMSCSLLLQYHSVHLITLIIVFDNFLNISFLGRKSPAMFLWIIKTEYLLETEVRLIMQRYKVGRV